MAKLIAHTELTQGSLVANVNWGIDDEVPIGIVLSNPCDLEHDKADYVLVAGIRDAAVIRESREYRNKINGATSPMSQSKAREIGKFLAGFIHNSNIGRYFFMDATSVEIGLPYLIVDLQRITTVRIQNHPLEVIAQLPSPYSEKLIMHYSSYVSRIGVDRITPAELASACRYLSGAIAFAEDFDFSAL